jgi:endonuclease/exonuclease/phosphatase family metal-dependent hydrolase
MKTLFYRLALLVIIGFQTNLTIAQEIKVMTYNIYHGEKNYDNGKSNLKDIARVINEYKPDFVAMQEVDSMTNRTAGFNGGVPKDLVAELSKLTGMHGFFGKAMDYSNGGYGEGLLSRHPAVLKVYHLPTPAGGEGRAMITVSSTLPNGKKIVFGGTHLCHEFEKNRVAQTEKIVELLTASNLPVILGGDFNITPDTQPYQILTSKLQDAAVVYGEPALTFPFDKPSERIDYIFLSKGKSWKVTDVKVIKSDASDHMPLLVTLKLN